MKQKMFKIRLSVPVPAMMYAVSKTQAWALLRENFGEVEEASALEIAQHVRAGNPIYGEPDVPAPNQQKLPV